MNDQTESTADGERKRVESTTDESAVTGDGGLETDSDESPRAVTLPDTVAERIDDRIEHTEFATVDEYVTYVLEEVLDKLERVDQTATPGAPDDAEMEASPKPSSATDEDEQPDNEGEFDQRGDDPDVDSERAAKLERRLESLGYL